MSKTFGPWDVDQDWFLSASVHEFVPAGHLAHFVRDTVRKRRDLSAIVGRYAEERVDFMAVTGLNRPDFRTISELRRRHLDALSALFVEVLKLCGAAGLVSLGHVAVGGSKVAANASRHKAMSYGRMARAEATLAAEVAEWLDRAEAAEHGADRRGDEMPSRVADKQRRLERIRAAKAHLEAEAPGEPDDADADGPEPSSGMRERGRRKTKARTAPDKAQRNFTDPDSRIQPSRGGFIAGCNGQIAVDAAHQVIVAQRLATNPADFAALVPLVDETRCNLGRTPREVSGDSGLATEDNLAALAERNIAAYLTLGRRRHGADHAGGDRHLVRKPRMAAMAKTLKRAGRRSRYRLRKQVVEPVFGQIKQARGFRQFLLRGLDKIRGEWALLCTVHNLLKLAKAAP